MARLLELAILFPLDGFALGFVVVRRLSWSPEEKLSASIALSLLLMYLGSFAIYVADLPPSAHWLMTGVSAIAAIANASAIRDLLGDREVRQALVAYAGLALWCLALTALVRNYSGGYWGGDWYEHFHRAIFFLNHWPLDTQFVGRYWLPARPPLMNLVSAHFLAETAPRFGLHQVISTLVNSVVALPALLLARTFSLSRVNSRVLATWLALNPMIVENATFPWTKLFVGFWVLLGVYFYRSGIQRGEPSRLVFSFASISGGVLTHYSAVPYAIFLGAHYLYVAFREHRGRLELAAIVIASIVLLGPWFGWATATYGPLTFTSNTTVTSGNDVGRATVSDGHTLSLGPLVTIKRPAALGLSDRFMRVCRNLQNTLVPHPFRRTSLAVPAQENRWGYVRDFLFLIYQTNLLFAFGSIGGLLLIYELSRRRRIDSAEARGFWLSFVAFAVIVGIAVVNVDDDFGLAHVGLQPIVVLGLALLASSWSDWPRAMKLLAMSGLVIDLAAGIFLQFEIQATALGRILATPGGGRIIEGGARLSMMTHINWLDKQQLGLEFLGDQTAPFVALLLAALAILLGWLLLPIVHDLSARDVAPLE